MTRHLGIENKNTKKAIRTPTLRDLEWAAGFLEGEGSFSSNGSSDRIHAAQKNKEPLIELREIFGGTIAWKTSKDGIWEWRIFGARARGVMLTLYSLFSKRRQKQIRKTLNR